jgi:kumamolisin
MASKNRVPVRGSYRLPVAGFRAVGAANPNQQIEVTVTLHPKTPIDASLTERMGATTPQARNMRSRSEIEQQFAATPESIAKVENFAREHNLKVVSKDPTSRAVVLSGSVSDFSNAFDVSLQRFENHGYSYRGRTGSVHIPEDLQDAVESVLGLDDRPQVHPHFRYRQHQQGPQAMTMGQSHTPDEIARLYNFPTPEDGTGQCIALIELGGGYKPEDLVNYFQRLSISEPAVTAVGVDHAGNRPTGDPNGADGEVVLDIEVAGAVAPGAKIVVYFAPNTDRGFLDAINAAIHDKNHQPSIISISWGSAESSWTPQATRAFDRVFQVAAAMGITVCCASGDDGSSDRVNDGRDHVDFPSSSPFVLACGGTRMDASGARITESVWNEGAGRGASGGGFSVDFPVPSWQSAVNQNRGRGVPDIAGDADPDTGYSILVDGVFQTVGGTSAVAPLWAGLIARMNQVMGAPLGYINPLLYGPLAGDCNDVTQGDNGSFSAGAGWDPCTGWGSPNGTKLLAGLGAKRSAIAA